jgi:hypothetical protein
MELTHSDRYQHVGSGSEGGEHRARIEMELNP